MVNNLSQREKGILIGTILGDAHIRALKKESRIEIGHGGDQKEYLFWKYKNLKNWVNAKPHSLKIYDKRYKKHYYQWRFKTRSHKIFSDLRRLFYRKRKKIIPKNIDNLLTSPLSLAVLYMDDGGRRNDCYGSFLNTLSFTKEENVRIKHCLKKRFGIDSRIHWVGDGYRIYIPSREAKSFSNTIYKYIIPSMIYKLPFNPVTTEFALLDRARDRRKRIETPIIRRSNIL